MGIYLECLKNPDSCVYNIDVYKRQVINVGFRTGSPQFVVKRQWEVFRTYVKAADLGQRFRHFWNIYNVAKVGWRCCEGIYFVFNKQITHGQRIMNFIFIGHAHRDPLG